MGIGGGIGERLARRWRCAALVAGAVFSFSTPSAQVAAEDTRVPTLEAVQARIAELESQGETAPRAVLETYRSAEAKVQEAREAERAAAQYELRVAEAPAELERLRLLLAAGPVELEDPVPGPAGVPDLERLAAEAEDARAAAVAELEAHEKEFERRNARRAQLPEETSQAQDAASQLAAELANSSAVEPDAPARTLLQARLRSARATLARLRQEQRAYDAEREVLRLRRDLSQRQVQQAQERARSLQAALTDRRQQEADAAAVAAKKRLREATIHSTPILAELAAHNAELAKLRSGESGLAAQVDREKRIVADFEARLRDVEAKASAAQRRIRAAGLSESVGVVLRRDYESLPTKAVLDLEARAISRRLSDVELQRINIGEERDELADLPGRTDRALQEIGPEADPAVRALLRDLLQDQRSLADDVLGDLDPLAVALYKQEETHARLRRTVESYRAFIEERILWIRSTQANPLPSLAQVPAHATDALAALRLENWERATREGISQRGWRALLLAILGTFGLVARVPLKRRRSSLAERVRSYRTDSFRLTLRALLLSIALASPVALLLWTLGWFLSPSPVDLFSSLGRACREMSAVYWVLAFVREIAAGKSLGEAHFRWAGEAARAIRRELRWFLPLVLLAGLVALTFQKQARTSWADSLGRTGFLVALSAQTLFLWRLLRSNLLESLTRTRRGFFARTHRLWSFAVIALPLALMGLALAGYSYTAFDFEVRLRYSMGLALGLSLLHALLLRWLFLTRRRLAIEQARQRAVAKQAAGDEEGATESGAPATFDEEAVDIPAVDAQTREVFRSGITLAVVLGLYFTWAGALPALRGFESVQLWPRLEIVKQEGVELELAPTAEPRTALPGAPASSGATDAGSAAAPSPQLTPMTVTPAAEAPEAGADPFTLTLADLSLGIIFVLLTWIAARNVPGLLEISLLQRLPFDSGGRYAVSTIVRYGILIAGFSAAFGAVGLRWGQIQWLAAAMTFGLAFGLQEIFANFVSGLIILLERPVRVGDIVTVGTTEGRITRLRMRATTILDWDRRELLIPNKEFITGSVINWTLSDPVTRLVIKVGIAYGSDTRRARELLLKAAKATKIVLDDPAPSAIFRNFGESSLDFELRVFMANRDLWPKLVDEVHARIDDSFRKAGIEISFPQRDLHVRSAEGLQFLDRRPEPREPSS